LAASAAILFALIGGAGLWAWPRSDPWPQFAGRFLALEVEPRSTSGFDLDPATAKQGGSPDSTLHVWAGAHGGESAGGAIDFAKATREGDRWFVPAIIPLRTGRRDLYFGMRERRETTVWVHGGVPRSLDPAQARWSDWLTARADVANGYKADPDGMAPRFRLVFAPEV
jgi:hypothetical protein